MITANQHSGAEGQLIRKMYDERVCRKAGELNGNEQDSTITNNMVFQEQCRAGIRARSLHGMDRSYRAEALHNLEGIPEKEKLVSFVRQQTPMHKAQCVEESLSLYLPSMLE